MLAAVIFGRTSRPKGGQAGAESDGAMSVLSSNAPERSGLRVFAGKGRSWRGQPEPPVIKGFLETSFLDWPGKIASVLFLPGCNFNCPFCHNHTLVSRPENFADIPLGAVLDRLRPFLGWVDGVVISGGEPTIHAGLAALCSRIKSLGFLVKLDTNGYRPEVVRELVGDGLVDMVAMDLKAPLNPLAYRRAAGRVLDLDRVAESVEFLKTSGVDHLFRSTILPAWHGQEELDDMRETLAGCRQWTLQAMNTETAWDPEPFKGLATYTSEDIENLQRDLADPASRPVR